MALSTEERRRLADMLAEAEATRVVVDPITASIKDADVVDAYEIQLEQIRRKLQAGAKISGHKVGLSSRAMQEMMGVDEPDYGHLLDSMFVYEQDTVDTVRSVPAPGGGRGRLSSSESAWRARESTWPMCSGPPSS